MLCGSVIVPKYLRISNPRLGFIFRVLQVGSVLTVGFMFYNANAFYTETKPLPFGIEVWIPPDKFPSNALLDTNVKHCTDPSSLHYTYSSSYVYEPNDCRRLSYGEMYMKSGRNIFFPTYFWKEEHTRESPPDQCANFTCNAGEVKTDDGGLCTCTNAVQYFVQNPEEIVLDINHGFEVEKLGPLGWEAGTLRRRSYVEKEDEDDLGGSILTIILKNTGRISETADLANIEKCEIGGDRKYTVAKSPISGPLKDWIACGGQSLDNRIEEIKSGLPGEKDAPPIRIIGLSLEIKFIYQHKHNEDHDGPVCYVIIDALPVWNSWTDVQYTTLPTATDRSSTYRMRYAYGITVHVQTLGVFQWADFNAVVHAIASAVVLLSLPGLIIQMISLYVVGRLSKIYRAVAIEEFNLVDRFHCVCARLLGYKACFDTLSEDPGAGSERELSMETLEKNLNAVVQEEKQAGVLNDEEVDNFAAFMMNQLDTHETNKICLQEFLHACNSEEAVKLGDLAYFFDEKTKGSFMERALGDVRSNLKQRKTVAVSKMSRVSPAGTMDELREAGEADEDHVKEVVM